MKLTIFLLFTMVLAGAETQPAKPPADACVPPPGGAAPSLPAKLLEGQGTVHFPITTKSPEAQKFFDQGVAQMDITRRALLGELSLVRSVVVVPTLSSGVDFRHR